MLVRRAAALPDVFSYNAATVHVRRPAIASGEAQSVYETCVALAQAVERESGICKESKDDGSSLGLDA